jgi:NADPH:quinone reductase-like Zn-dependent oxidoreductase
LNCKDLFFPRPSEQHGLSLPKPTIPVSDADDEIVAMGPSVTKFAIGDRVRLNVAHNWLDGVVPMDFVDHALGYGTDGVLCQYRVLDEAGVVRLPDFSTAPQGLNVG